MTDIRKGQAPAPIERGEFTVRFHGRFQDPAFDAEKDALARLEAIAWDAYQEGRKAPVTRKAGPGYADPDYELSVEWIAIKERLDRAQAAWADPATRSRVLLVCGAARNDGTCPGEISKTWRLTLWAKEVAEQAGLEVDLLDLSRLTSDYDRHIHACKGCVSTAMPLCHWPCSCYPNHALGQTNDWMAEIYERWVAAHGVFILCPVNWYHAPGGKKPDKAKALELAGWDYPKHLAGRTYGVVVHGDVAGIEGSRRQLSDWLDWMGLVDAGAKARLDRFIGYYEPYATSHEALDRDSDFQEEVRNVARALVHAVGELRAGRLAAVQPKLQAPRPK